MRQHSASGQKFEAGPAPVIAGAKLVQGSRHRLKGASTQVRMGDERWGQDQGQALGVECRADCPRIPTIQEAKGRQTLGQRLEQGDGAFTALMAKGQCCAYLGQLVLAWTAGVGL